MNRYNYFKLRVLDDRGYTLLFAVLTSALVLGIAVFIVSTSTKQFELSAASRSSVYSFYAADAGIECVAMAYENGYVEVGSGVTMSCNGSAPKSTNFVAAGSGYPPILTSNITQTPVGALNFDTGNGTCAVITIYDGYDSAVPTPNHYTFMDSRGYNKCSASFGPDTTHPGTVERALRLGKKG